MKSAPVPDRGDLIVVTFDPQAGHEQAGRRPALVLSTGVFTRSTRLIVCCPITNTRRRSLFHVELPPATGLTGFVMCEQVRSLDYRARGAKRIGTAPASLLNDVFAIVEPILFG